MAATNLTEPGFLEQASLARAARAGQLCVLLASFVIWSGHLFFSKGLRAELPYWSQVTVDTAMLLILVSFAARLSRWGRLRPQAWTLSLCFQFLAVVYAGCSLVPETGIRVPAAAAFSLACLGLSLLMVQTHRWRRFAKALHSIAATISMIACLSGFYGVSAASIGWFFIDLPSAMLMFVLAASTLPAATSASSGKAADLRHGGARIRRLLLPASFLVPLALGWLRVMLEQAGLIGPPVGQVLHVAVTVAVLVAIVGWMAGRFDQESTRHTLLEQALEESESLLHGLIENSSDPICICDSRARVLRLNSSAQQLFGYSDQESRLLLLNQLLPHETARSLVGGDLFGGDPALRNVEVRLRSGERQTLAVRGSMKLRNGELNELVLTFYPVGRLQPVPVDQHAA
ncbi:MAG: PAS domain-containing protein [Bryobacteraceae bacterium]